MGAPDCSWERLEKELRGLLMKVEFVVNSRPLVEHTTVEETAITPNDLLIDAGSHEALQDEQVQEF